MGPNLWVFSFLALLTCLAPGLFAEEAPSRSPVSFSRDVAPILAKQCQTCHGPDKSKGKFRLDTFGRLTKPGKSKKAPIVSGKPDQSELFRLITSHDDDERMPQDAEPLPAAQIATVRAWIEQGAAYDGGDPNLPLASLGAAENPSAPAVYDRPFPITALAFNPEGTELAASGYHEVTLWSAADGKLLGRIDHLPERICSIAWSPDGKQLAVAGGTPGLSGQVVMCDPASSRAGKVLDRIADLTLVVRFSPDGEKLAAGGADNVVKIFETKSGKQLVRIEQHADWVTDLAFSPDGTQLVTASRDRSARVFDVTTGEMKSAYLKHEDPLFAVAWSDDGKQIFSAGRDRKVHAWQSADAKPVGQISGFDGDLFKIQSGFGFIFTSSADGVIRQFSQNKRELVRKFAPASDWIYCLAIDPRSHRLAGGCYNGEVDVWDINDGTIVGRFPALPVKK